MSRPELFRALGALAESPAPGHDRLAQLLGLPDAPTAAVYTDVFVLQLYPYASVYVGAEGMLGGDARDRVAGFFRALDAPPPVEPDHLAVLLGAYAELADREAAAADAGSAAAWQRARATLLWEHLLAWVPAYVGAVEAIAPDPYRAWAALLAGALRDEAAVLAPPPRLPLHLRGVPPLDHPGDAGAHAFLDQLLAPVRTGVVVTRATLTSAARELGLGLRVAERRYALAHLLDQDPAATLRWLGEHAAGRAAAWSDLGWLGTIGAFWRTRAEDAAAMLVGLADDADAVVGDSWSEPGASVR